MKIDIDEKCVNELRVLANEMITNAESGHPGIALSSAPIIYSLYVNILGVDGQKPDYYNRDRFVLSAGHGSSILYATLFAMGYKISEDDLQNFRKIGSLTPGHPEVGNTPGIDASTGPLGQGISNAVGMAIAEKYYEANFNQKDCELFNNKIFCMTGDGCLMEGISYEALSLAGNLKLDNFVFIYDCNQITIEGKTDITFSDDIEMRFKAIGFDVFVVKNGNDTKEITKMLFKATKCKKPSIVVVKTIIGYGTELAGSEKIHGKPLSVSELEKLKISLFVNKPNFRFSNDVKNHFEKKIIDAKLRLYQRDKVEEYKEKFPKNYKLFKMMLDGKSFDKAITKLFNLKIKSEGTTRDINHNIMQFVDGLLPNFFGGSADVSTSTKAYIENIDAFSQKNYSGRLVHYGIREHSMAGISNGIALYGGLIPYESCFLTFADYLKPSLRMTALMGLRSLYIFSHDSITAGQDGPTHQPVEQLPSLRLIPDTIISRPYNSSEILASYIWLLQNKKPVCILVSKDKMEFIESDIEKAEKGGYVLKENTKADITIISTGSDLDRCLKACEILKQNKISARIVSLPCLSIFESQTTSYINRVLKNIPKVFVESSDDNIWYKFAEKTDLIINLETFGKSGSPDEVLKYIQLDAEGIAKKICKCNYNFTK